MKLVERLSLRRKKKDKKKKKNELQGKKIGDGELASPACES